MNCALWLNRRKIRHASEISENIDIAALRGYFLAGSLEKWLCENGGESYAEKLAAISPDDGQLNEKLAEIFGEATAPMIKLTSAEDEPQDVPVMPALPTSGSYIRFFESGSAAHRMFGSLGSFGIRGSFGGFSELLKMLQSGRFGSGGSFTFGSYSQWAWLFELFWKSYGSFTFGSFTTTSFHEWEWEWLLRLFGGYGSFGAASFGFSSFDVWSVLFGSYGSFGHIGSGSFAAAKAFSPDKLPFLDEYDKIMLETLMICPLDRFGYGIHNI